MPLLQAAEFEIDSAARYFLRLLLDLAKNQEECGVTETIVTDSGRHSLASLASIE
jgi:hypothetical protein